MLLGRAGICVCVTFTYCQRKIIIFCQHLSLFTIREFADKTLFLCYITQESSDRSCIWLLDDLLALMVSFVCSHLIY